MKEAKDVEGLDALLAAARRLLELDPTRFRRVLAICRTYVAIYDRPDEHEDVFASRLLEMSVRKVKVLA